MANWSDESAATQWNSKYVYHQPFIIFAKIYSAIEDSKAKSIYGDNVHKEVLGKLQFWKGKSISYTEPVWSDVECSEVGVGHCAEMGQAEHAIQKRHVNNEPVTHCPDSRVKCGDALLVEAVGDHDDNEYEAERAAWHGGDVDHCYTIANFHYYYRLTENGRYVCVLQFCLFFINSPTILFVYFILKYCYLSPDFFFIFFRFRQNQF